MKQINRNILLLPGVACKSEIIQKYAEKYIVNNCNIIKIEWPTDQTSEFKNLESFKKWIISNIELSNDIDIAISHSMGGLTLLELVTNTLLNIEQLIITESFFTEIPPF